MDFDGDELNLIDEPNIIAAAKRTISNHNILPLFYDAQKAGKQKFTVENRYACLMMAHEFGGAAIGGVSNTMSKLWNSVQDIIMAARICCFNNQVIDAAKTGKIINYPEDIGKPINQLKHGRMPWFFQFTPNGRVGDIKCCTKPTDNISIMNKIALKFDKLKKSKLTLGYDGVDDFNAYMLLDGEPKINVDVFAYFDFEIFKIEKDLSEYKQHKQRYYYDLSDQGSKAKEAVWWRMKLDEIYKNMLEIFKDPKLIYDSLVIEMFVRKAMSESRKSQFWTLFGEQAYNNIKNNLTNYHKCTHKGCKMKVPNWDIHHNQHHQQVDEMHKECVNCHTIFEFKQTNTSNRIIYCPDCIKKQSEFAKQRRKERLAARMSGKRDYGPDMGGIIYRQ